MGTANNEPTNYLVLKWGTLKAWNFTGNEEAIKLFRRYKEIGSSLSVMIQHDTPEQKEIICKLIDLTLGQIYLDWDGRYVSKEEAKVYVMEYGAKQATSSSASEVVENKAAAAPSKLGLDQGTKLRA